MFDQEKTIQSARSTILAVVIFTLINIFAIAFAEYYFLYSAYVPQVLIAFALYESPGLLMPMVIASLVYMFPYLQIQLLFLLFQIHFVIKFQLYILKLLKLFFLIFLLIIYIFFVLI